MKKKCEGLLPSEMRRLHQLEDENGRLKKITADLSQADFSDPEFAISNLSSSIGECFAVSFARGIDLRDVSPGASPTSPKGQAGRVVEFPIFDFGQELQTDPPGADALSGLHVIERRCTTVFRETCNELSSLC